MITCAIIDNDETSASVMEKFCRGISQFEVMGTYQSGLDFIENGTDAPQLLFLDIEMPGMTGFEIIDSLSNSPMVVIMSGKTEYAYSAFEVNVVDFLLKPITYKRFLKSVTKIRSQNTLRSLERSKARNDDNLFIRKRNKLHKVRYSDIIYIQSKSEYINIVTAEDQFLRYGAIKEIIQALPNVFVRVHRSYIVNIDHVKMISAKRLDMGIGHIPVSDSYVDELLERIDVL